MLLLALSDVVSWWKECVRVGPVAVQGMSTAGTVDKEISKAIVPFRRSPETPSPVRFIDE
jgi:hypothetical protein